MDASLLPGTVARLVAACLAGRRARGLIEPAASQGVPRPPDADENLLPRLCGAASAESAADRATLRRLRAACAAGCQLTLWPPLGNTLGLLGRRLLWWSRACSGGRLVAVLSSHLGRRPDRCRQWFAALRGIVDELAGDDLVLTASHTTTEAWLERYARLRGQAILRVAWDRRLEQLTLEQWLERRLSAMRTGASDSASSLWLSPPLSAYTVSDGGDAERTTGPLGDRALLDLADVSFVLRLRDGGRLLPLVRRQCTVRRPDQQLWLACGASLITDELGQALMAEGARHWRTFPTESPRRLYRRGRRISLPVREWRDGFGEGEYLTHCTRAMAGPWVDQSAEEFLDDLLLDRPAADHGAVDALLRILAQRRLTASSRGIRGGHAVVCFTAVPPAQLATVRTFQRHRGRWDFCPYGLSIRREWLMARGAQPVIYGDESVWQQLAPLLRPLFQRRTTGGRRPHSVTHDWRVEQEWRVVGSLDLRGLPADEACVFVPDETAARLASFLGPWPVRVIPSRRAAPSAHAFSRAAKPEK